MSRFWEHAAQVMEAASTASKAGSASDLALVLDASGALRIVMQPGWTAEALHAQHGGAVYQVSHTAEGIRVEGRACGVSCTLRTNRPERLIALSAPAYTVLA